MLRHAVAFVVGAEGIRVEDDSELRGALEKALAANSPVIVDVVAGHDFPFRSHEYLVGPKER